MWKFVVRLFVWLPMYLTDGFKSSDGQFLFCEGLDK
jgi:hypothetical protein